MKNSMFPLAVSRIVIIGNIIFTACHLLSPSLLADAENVSGYFVDQKGKTVNFQKIDEVSKGIAFRYGPEDKLTSVPLTEVSDISFGEKNMTADIKLKDGRQIVGRCADPRGFWSSKENQQYFRYFYFDEIARKPAEESLGYYEIKRIVIGDAIGHFRRCPHCKGSWPDSYLFCPHDGTATAWGEPAAPIAQNVQVTPEDRAKRHAKFLEATVNANLSRAGYDPASERAQKVRDFSLLWMNPLADPKEIHGKLDELRKIILSEK